VLKHFHPRRHEHFHESCVRIPLLLGDGARVNVQRRPAVRVPQKFLRHLYIHSHRPQIRRQRVTEVVPTDLLAYDACPLERRPNAPLQQTVRAERLFASESDRWKEEIRIRCIERLFLPLLKCAEHQWMERNRTPGTFGLGIAETVAHTGTQDIDFER
jgi:hypothetical protein